MALTQANRRLRIQTPFAEDTLLVAGLSVRERLSALFRIDVDLVSERSDLDFEQMVGAGVGLAVHSSAGDRHFHGLVSRFSLSGTDEEYVHYRAELVPWLWLLTRTTDCRIFQHKSVVDIAQQIFGEYGFADFELRLTGTYAARDYCVQYRETDYNFLARLFEDEGITFFFRHEEAKHVLVLTDAAAQYKPCPGIADLRLMHATGGADDDDIVTEWQKVQEIRPGKHTLTDYNFEKPSLDLAADATGDDARKHEVYDYPGGPMSRDGMDRLVKIRQQEEDASRVVFTGSSHCRSLAVGHTFKVTAVPAGSPAKVFDGEYLVTECSHTASQNYRSTDEAGEATYQNEVVCVTSKTPIRPPRITPCPTVVGVQTAVVVGPSGEEIFVDKHGRVKVQFHWDREGKKDENSSCWVRVSQGWAGKNWGMVTIPRMGQEVVVSFLEGDPDRPLITGRVYNGEQVPPYDLPANMTQSGIKSRSSKGGSPANFNEIRFEDKKGEEEVYIHAEKNETIVVENDKSESVGHDESITIGNDRTEQVGHDETMAVGNNRTRNVGANETISVALNRNHAVGVNEAIAIGAAQEVAVGAYREVAVGAYQSVDVGAYQNITVGADQKIQVGKDQKEQVGKNYQLKVGDDRTTDIGKNETLKVGKVIKVNAGDEIVFTTGQSSITMKKDGTIVIKGKTITVDAMQKIQEKAMQIASEAKTKHETKGAMVTVEASGINTIKGGLVKIN